MTHEERIAAMVDQMTAIFNSDEAVKFYENPVAGFVAGVDQLMAASRDSNKQFERVKDLRPRSTGTEIVADDRRRHDLVARVLVAMSGAKFCPHVWPPRPLKAALAIHVVACAECLPMMLTEPDPAEDNLCDFCHEPTDWFTEIALGFMNIHLLGDACESCKARLMPSG
jgi:hypothetical protein